MEQEKKVMTDKLFEYHRVRSSDTGLNVDIFIDDGEAYKRNGHPLWVCMQNCYNDISDVIPIEVGVSCQVVSTPPNLGISLTDYQRVLRYVSQNRELIIQLADGIIGHLEYEERQCPIGDDY